MSVHERLKLLRERMGMNQTEFCRQAETIGLTLNVIRYRKIESGKAKVSLNEVAMIISALGVGSSTLLFDAESALPKPIVGKKDRRAAPRPTSSKQ